MSTNKSKICLAKLSFQLFQRWYFDTDEWQKQDYESALNDRETIDKFLSYLDGIKGYGALMDFYSTAEITQLLKEGRKLETTVRNYQLCLNVDNID